MVLSDGMLYSIATGALGVIGIYWKLDQARNKEQITELKDRVTKLEATVQLLNTQLDDKDKQLNQKEIENLSLKYRLGEMGGDSGSRI